MDKKFIFIAGVCIIEDTDVKKLEEVAEYLKDIAAKYDVDFIFKASYDKANRTSLNSFRGIGFYESMYMLGLIKYLWGIKILTDVHTVEEAKIVAGLNMIDIVQLPAFLCRQTDLVVALGNTHKTVNIKKGQFMAPSDVKYIIEKIESTGNNNIMLTERGTCFGYRDLVTDFRSFVQMKQYGYPVIYDVTHSQQQMSAGKGQSGGHRKFAIPLAKAAVATGYVDGLFVECHPNPKEAKCDSAVALHLGDIEPLLRETVKIWKVANGQSS